MTSFAGLGADVGQIAEDADAVHLGDHLVAEIGQAAVAGLVAAGADQVLRVVGHLHDADAELLEQLDVADLVLDAVMFWKPRMMPVLPSSLACRMSAVVCTCMIRSPFSRNQAFQRGDIVASCRVKPSQTEQVQLAAVSPPLRMSSNTERPKSEMIRPSMTTDAACRLEAM